MTKRLTAAALSLLATALLAGLFAAGAEAGKPSEKTRLTAEFNENFALVGEVKSVAACQPRRELVLIEDNEGMRTQVDSTRSKDNGRYSFGRRLYLIGADYYVKAKKRTRPRVICRGDQVKVPLG